MSNDVGKVSNDGEYLTLKREVKEVKPTTRDIRSFFIQKDELVDNTDTNSSHISSAKEEKPKPQDIRNVFRLESKQESRVKHESKSRTKRSRELSEETLCQNPHSFTTQPASAPPPKRIKLETQ